MVAWILTASFVLHGLSLFFILILYTRLSHLKEMEQKQSTVMKQIEEVVSSYLMEMKEQNDEFIQRFREIKQSQFPKTEIEEIAGNERPAFEDVSAPTDQDFRHLLTAQAEENQSNPHQGQPFNDDIENEKKEHILVEQPNVEELTPEQIKKMAVSLQKRGLTAEEIAKYLHRGKTEIELLLVFSKNR